MLLCSGACDGECKKEPSAYAFDEPGPWDDTPAMVFGYTEDPVIGTLHWIGPVTEGELDPALLETSVTLEITLDTSSAAGVRSSLTCDGELEIDATLSIVTTDGALDETIPIVLTAGAGSSHVSAIVDLTDYDFAGTLELSPAWTHHEMRLLVSWDRDKRMIGVMQTVNVLDAQVDPDANSGFYAVIL
jgi:hypothetical protein